jgi:hypothetical protein
MYIIFLIIFIIFNQLPIDWIIIIFFLFFFLDFTQKGKKLQYGNYKHIIVNMHVGNYANFIII